MENNNLQSLEAQKKSLENALEGVNKQILAIKTEELRHKAEIASVQNELTACDNALNALFDGIKYRADEENPFPFVAPMKCYPNMFYSVTENDGIKNIVKKFVCVATTPTIVDDSNFAECMEVW